MNIFEKLAELDFPLGQYVLVGSAPLAARGIREARDLDIAVTSSLWDRLASSGDYLIEERYGWQFLVDKESGLIDIIKQLDWDKYPTTVEEAILGADIIEGFPFLNVPETIKFKTALGREKDFLDIETLGNYLKIEK